MNKIQNSHSVRLVAALVAGLAASETVIHAQGIQASATLTGTPGAGGTYDYTLMLSNAPSATASIEGLFYAWIPGFFFLPSTPSSVSAGTSGWSAKVEDSKSLEFQGTSSDAIAPGESLSFSFVTTDSPTTLAGMNDGYPIGDSYVYPGTINFGVNSSDELITVQSTPEPSTLALLSGGTLCVWAFSLSTFRRQRVGGQ